MLNPHINIPLQLNIIAFYLQQSSGLVLMGVQYNPPRPLRRFIWL